MFTYAEIEKALAVALQIRPEERPAFAARLRHLRNLGIPEAKPGSGKRIWYAMEDAHQMLVALLLESLACSPRSAVSAAERYKKHYPARTDLMVVLPPGDVIPATVERLLSLARVKPVLAVLNLRCAFSGLEAALSNQTAAGGRT